MDFKIWKIIFKNCTLDSFKLKFKHSVLHDIISHNTIAEYYYLIVDSNVELYILSYSNNLITTNCGDLILLDITEVVLSGELDLYGIVNSDRYNHDDNGIEMWISFLSYLSIFIKSAVDIDTVLDYIFINGDDNIPQIHKEILANNSHEE